MDQSTKPCATCKERPRVPAGDGKKGSCYCRECWNARMRDYRQLHGHPKKKPQANCSRCGAERDGRHPAYCRACWRGIGEERRAKPCITCGAYRDPEDKISTSYCNSCFQDRRLQREYGLTLKEFDVLLAGQDRRCAICRTEANGRTWHVDHDHGTGRVRGVLCDNCNRGIGHLRDNPALLRRAADYLEVHASV